MIGSPRVVTIRMIVAQPTPSADATRDTAPSWAPTWSNAHARARSVRHARGSIAGCCSVQVFLEHNACGQHQTRLCQHTTTDLPPIGRSRTHTGRRSFARATAPQSGHGTTRAMVSTNSSSSPPASAAASTRNPSNPNNAATTEPVTSASTWGSSTIRVILVVITDRASPRPTISSFQSPRRVAQVSPLPGSWRRASNSSCVRRFGARLNCLGRHSRAPADSEYCRGRRDQRAASNRDNAGPTLRLTTGSRQLSATP